MRGSLRFALVGIASVVITTTASAQDEDFAGTDVLVDADATWFGIKTNIGTLTVAAGVTLGVEGELEVQADTIVIDGSVVADGAGSPGVRGSGASGQNGNGMGAGRAGGERLRGGGGGAFGGAGGCGGRFAGGGVCGGAGGVVYGSLSDMRYVGSSGGSGGGIAADSPGGSSGGGGGIIALFARTLTISGTVSVNGGSGGVGGSAGLVSGGGGGSGGAIILSADTFDVTGAISASGGPGGSVSCSFGSTCSGGGGGGGGRAMLLYSDALPTFEVLVNGGARGAGPPTAASGGAAGSVYRDHVPVVILEPIPGGPAGVIDVGYTLRDAEGDTCMLEVAIVQDSGAIVLATEGVGSGDGTDGLTASPTGIAHTYAWNAAADVTGAGPVQLRVRGRDPHGWGPPAFTTVEITAVPSDSGVPDADTGTPMGDAATPDGGADTSVGPVPDSGAPPGDRDGGGCSCRAGAPRGGRDAPIGAVLLLVALGFGRRLRRKP